MSQSGNQGQVGTYYKTELYDPISSTRFRSIYQLPTGVSVNTKKIRLLNARLKKTSGAGDESPYMWGLGGSVESPCFPRTAWKLIELTDKRCVILV